MSAKSKILSGLVVLFLLSGSCRFGNDGDPVDNHTGSQESFGTFLVSVQVQEGIASLLGLMYDGPLPPAAFFEEVAIMGCCKLLKASNPFCAEGCGSDAKCVANNVCQPYPNEITVGTVTVTGVATKDGATHFTMDPIGAYYRPVGIKLAYPPFAEGDIVTLDASGDTAMSAFTLTASAISPITILNDSLPCGDGQGITLEWDPPKAAGNSTIFVMVDITYHGGTKAKIECDCEDNGSLTIPAELMDKLKSYGISGYPRVDITRRSVGINDTAKAKLAIESSVSMFLQIPGIISCSDNSNCPEGSYCASDQRCREIETP